MKSCPVALLCCLAMPAAALAQPAQYTNGTAFFITRDGAMLTAEHVVRGCAGRPYVNGRFILDGHQLVSPEDTLGEAAEAVETTIGVRVVATDRARDLALLRPLPAVEVENIAPLRPQAEALAAGEPAVAVGYPLAAVEKLRLLDYEIDKGSVLALAAPGAPEGTFFVSGNKRPLGTHGYSGGPVLDKSGGVMGVLLAVSCLSRECSENIKHFKERYGDDAMRSGLPPETYQEELENYLDSSMIAGLGNVRAFLAAQNVALPGPEAEGESPADRIRRVGRAIANVGCTARNELEAIKALPRP